MKKILKIASIAAVVVAAISVAKTISKKDETKTPKTTHNDDVTLFI